MSDPLPTREAWAVVYGFGNENETKRKWLTDFLRNRLRDSVPFTIRDHALIEDKVSNSN